jgi:hypothetical protein
MTLIKETTKMNIIITNRKVDEIDTILNGEVFETFSISAKQTNPNGQNMSINMTMNILKVMNSSHFFILSLFDGFLYQIINQAVVTQARLNARRNMSFKELNSIMLAIS